MQFFVIFTPKQAFQTQGMPADFPDVERQEQAQTWVLYGDGSLRQVWALEPKGRGAAALLDARSPEHLQQVISTLPADKGGLRRREGVPARAASGFHAAGIARRPGTQRTRRADPCSSSPS